MASGQKCYKRFTSQSEIRHGTAPDTCRRLGFELASIKTQQEFEDFKKMALGRDMYVELVGLVFGSASLPYIYRPFFSWSDRTAIYNAQHITLKYPAKPGKTLYYQYSGLDSIKLHVHEAEFGFKKKNFICEKTAHLLRTPSVEFSSDQQPLLVFQQSKQSVVICPDCHVTHAFLSCDPKGH